MSHALQAIFATNNPDKIKEAAGVFADCGCTLLTLKQLGLVSNPAETGTTYQENALIKARAAHRAMHGAGLSFVVISEDSGLSVDALGGRPGVDSAMLLGPDACHRARCEWVIEQMRGHTNRAAAFVACCIAILPCGKTIFANASLPGQITHTPVYPGFGYDPVLFLPEYGKNVSELSLAQKNAISHRGQALRSLFAQLQ